MIKSLVSILAVSLLMAPLAEARRNGNREALQESRINQGVKSGELTAHEEKKLDRGQDRIDNAQDKAMADEELSGKEKVKLEKMQDRQSRKIFRQKHDGQERRGAGAPGDGPTTPDQQ